QVVLLHLKVSWPEDVLGADQKVGGLDEDAPVMPGQSLSDLHHPDDAGGVRLQRYRVRGLLWRRIDPVFSDAGQSCSPTGSPGHFQATELFDYRRVEKDRLLYTGRQVHLDRVASLRPRWPASCSPTSAEEHFRRKVGRSFGGWGGSFNDRWRSSEGRAKS